jgi:hypothetical protein
MAKKKRKISDIKSALLSNTSFIKDTEKEKTTTREVKDSTLKLPDNMIEVDKSTLSRIKILANYYQKDYQELIGEALQHYLRIKKLDVDEALKNIVVGDDDEE